MAQHAAAENPFVSAFASSTKPSLDDAHDTALSKQYNVRVDFVAVETNGNKKYFDSHIEYTGAHYQFMVALEAELIKLLEKMNELGKVIASGEEPA